MLETELFPTLDPVIRQMLNPFIERNGSGKECFTHQGSAFLDPSAGLGNILDYLCNKLEVERSKLFAIEINSDLRYTLQGKGYRVIGIDFLEYDEPLLFDLILMNPPFSQGVSHVLKAWEILSDGGNLVTLLNANTLLNPYTKERKQLLHLLASCNGEVYDPKANLGEFLAKIESHGCLEWLGQCFLESECPTDVVVVLVRLNKPVKEQSINFEGINFDLDEEIASGKFAPNTLAHNDMVVNLVARYNAARRILIECHDMQDRLEFFLNGISRPVYDSREILNENFLLNSCSLNEKLMVLKSRFWNTVFNKTELGSKTTTDFQLKFNEFSLTQSSLSFTEANIKEILFMFMINMNEIMNDSLVKVFDEATSHHKDNKVSEGWITNKSWKLNKRIIMPNGVYFDNFRFRLLYYQEPFLNDLDKIMCWLCHAKFNEIHTLAMTISDFCNLAYETGEYKKPFQSTFFTIRIYKKGTVHLDFKDLKLLEDFNRKAAEGKKWLGSENPSD
ncbi:DUF4942 domain-containing protein (plasmid) [Nostoc sp. C052]|uniref:DUF4942 domain-containing protein n=1 Tax=Nostoc sp. C052 TaxID=2576902 RepID=UPI0015C37BB8|nr:DUF4942 domain-containing protein [Nostoc sp. C052]QLE46393.1 DUF4942 domain-containing protein [Nostoc sp. C052]